MSILRFIIPYEKIEDIPLEEYKHLHKQYWTFIAENRLNYKPIIISSHGSSIHILNNCFACSYVVKTRRINLNLTKQDCNFCPIKNWGNKARYCFIRGSKYNQYNQAAHYGQLLEAKELALQIANLDWEDYKDGES